MSGPQLSRKYLLFLHDRAGHTRPLHSSYYELSTLDKLQRHPLRRFPGAAQRTDGVRGLAGRHAGGAGPAARCKRLLPHRFRRPCAAFRAQLLLYWQGAHGKAGARAQRASAAGYPRGRHPACAGRLPRAVRRPRQDLPLLYFKCAGRRPLHLRHLLPGRPAAGRGRHAGCRKAVRRHA